MNGEQVIYLRKSRARLVRSDATGAYHGGDPLGSVMSFTPDGTGGCARATATFLDKRFVSMLDETALSWLDDQVIRHWKSIIPTDAILLLNHVAAEDCMARVIAATAGRRVPTRGDERLASDLRVALVERSQRECKP